VGFSFGFPVDERIQRIVDLIPDPCWCPARESDWQIRDGAWVARAAGLVDLPASAAGDRLFRHGTDEFQLVGLSTQAGAVPMEEVSDGQPAADR
jgi:hypothetical protein